jgi:hypothetical protein
MGVEELAHAVDLGARIPRLGGAVRFARSTLFAIVFVYWLVALIQHKVR